jgi:hypothetical protein
MSDCRIAVSSAQGFGGDEMTADPDDGDAGNVHEAGPLLDSMRGTHDQSHSR